MLKGHAKIELTNVKTGEKRVIEHDNMLTNYWRDMLSPRGMVGRSLLQTGIAWDKRQFFGGVLLFENTLNNDADDYRFPHGNKMVAHGSNVAYSGVDTTMGSFNESESVFDTDSATLVWDWTQERGNGTISAIGLTSAEGGLIGGGRGDECDTADNYVLNINTHWANNTPNLGGGSNDYSPVYVDEQNNKLYGAYFNSNNLYVREYQFAMTSVDLLTLLTSNSVNPTFFDVTRFVSKTISLSSFGFGSNVVGFGYEGKLYITASGNWGSGSRTFARYDFETGVVDSISVTNNTGETIVLQSYQVGRSGFIIKDGILYGITTAHHAVYINLADNTDCGTIKDGDGNTIVRANENGYTWMLSIWGEVMFSKGQIYANGKGDVNQKQMYVLESKNVAKRRALAPLAIGYYGLGTSVGYVGGNQAVGYYGNNENGNVFTVYNMMCLATKNNLDSAVTKTADMTMRVTYTIREVSE